MTIEQLDTTKVLISLCNEDMEDYSLSFDTMSFYNDSSRRVLMRLLRLACNKTGMPFGSKTVLVEALPHQSGCLLLVTLMEKQKKRKTYRVKRIKERPCYCFDGAEELLSGIESLNHKNVSLHMNSLWLFGGKYYLIFDYPLVSRRARGVLCEYSRELSITDVRAARIRESGKLLCGFNAVEMIGRRI